MNLVRLVYCSKAKQEISPELVEDILVVARKENTKNQITGVLGRTSWYFLQFLEGNYKEVNQLLVNIAGDDRHDEFTLLEYRAVSQRHFPDWSMLFIEDQENITRLFERYLSDTGYLEINHFADASVNYLKKAAIN